jgi:chromosome segregation protein
MVVYRQLFGGGKADLRLLEVEDGDALLDGGIEIVCQPPGKKLQNISLLSGGEQALTAVSLMFSIFLYKPSPFCIMDEIDAPLDDNNVLRFRNMLREFAKGTQFIIITHNKITMELADTIYGVTMQETGVSSLVSVAFEQVDNLHAQAAS